MAKGNLKKWEVWDMNGAAEEGWMIPAPFPGGITAGFGNSQFPSFGAAKGFRDGHAWGTDSTS